MMVHKTGFTMSGMGNTILTDPSAPPSLVIVSDSYVVQAPRPAIKPVAKPVANAAPAGGITWAQTIGKTESPTVPQVAMAEVVMAAGPLNPGDLRPVDPTSSVPGPSSSQPSRWLTKDDALAAGTCGAGAIVGEIVGGIAGQALIPIPVVGEQIGQWTGALLGTLAGFAFHKMFNT